MAVRIDPFSAVIYDGTTSAKEFERQFAITAAINGWNADKQLEFIPLYLKGKALRVYNANETRTDVATVMKTIKDGCGLSPEQAMRMFDSCKRQSGENLERFGERLVSLLNLAAPDLAVDIRKTVLKSKLCSNLPAHMVSMVTFNAAVTWDQLMLALAQAYPGTEDVGSEMSGEVTRSGSRLPNANDQAGAYGVGYELHGGWKCWECVTS